jgi:hypothetical protein
MSSVIEIPEKDTYLLASLLQALENEGLWSDTVLRGGMWVVSIRR